ncbi:MAG: hypothetical protein ACOH1T_12150 [Microbacteriaceae bacterium]
MTLKLASVIPVWVLTVIGAILVAVLATGDASHESPFADGGGNLDWLSIVFAAAIIATFVIQLAIQRKEGFVSRVVASIVGSLLILGVATAVLAVMP